MIWNPSPYPPALAGDDVHLWRVAVEQTSDALAMLRSCLSCEECTRADRYRFALDRAQFLVGRAVLRMLLAGYLNLVPKEVKFTYEGRGKPAVRGDVSFNLSHSGPWLLLGFTRARAIGVDVEQVRPMPNAAELAQRNFAPGEWNAWKMLPEPLRLDAFFRAWTRKEAFIKAVGQGLAYPLDQFEVTLTPHDEAALVHVRHDQAEAARWSLLDVPIGPGCQAAAVVEHAKVAVRQMEWVRT